MNDLVRPTSHYRGGIAASAPSGVLATIPNPPPEIARLPAGTILRGVVVGDDGKGHTLIKTDRGILAVATKTPLAKDSEVVLQIRSSGVQLHALIMQTRAPSKAAPAPQPPPLKLPGNTSGPGGEGIARPAGSQGGSLPGTTGQPPPATPQGLVASTGTAAPRIQTQTVRAIIQGPAGPIQAREGALPQLQGAGPSAYLGPAGGLPEALLRLAPGTEIQLRILAVSAAGPAGAGSAPAAAQGPPPTGGLAAASLSPPAGVSGAAGPAADGSRVTGAPKLPAQIASAVAAGPGGNAGAARQGIAQPGPIVAAPAGFAGLVTGVTHAGHPILSTPLGILTLELEAPLPIGGRVALELAAGGPPKAAESPALPAMRGGFGHAWPALEEALRVLNEPGAGAAPGAAPQGVPQPGPRLASGLLFFLAALSGGDLARWLGLEALQVLRDAGREVLIGRLARDLAQMGRIGEAAGGTGAAGGDWRLLPIPLWDGDQVRQLRLFLRRRDERQGGGKQGDRDGPTRFVLELEMSRMGDMQLDGLVRAKRFDLVMRTRAALPEAMRRDIRQIFDEANQAAGYSGSLGFQASADWRFLPLEPEPSSGAPAGLVV